MATIREGTMTKLRFWIGAAALAAVVALPSAASARFGGVGHSGAHVGAFHSGPVGAFRAGPGPGVRAFSGPHVGAFSGAHMHHGPFLGHHHHFRGAAFIGAYSSYDPGYYDQGYYDQGYYDQGYYDQGYYDQGYYGNPVAVVPAVLPLILHAMRAHRCGLVSVKHYSHHHAVWTKVRSC
jgi:hypothetical protein